MYHLGCHSSHALSFEKHVYISWLKFVEGSWLITRYVMQDEIEIEAKVLRLGKRVGVAMVELREKKTGKVIAQGRHAKYLAVSSKL